MASEPTLGNLARDTLDGLLVPLGFQSGQGGDGPPGSRDQVIFCAARDTFDDHFRHLVEIGKQIPDGGCLDLVIEGSLTDGITRVDLEGFGLSDLLKGLDQLEAAERAKGWPRGSVGADLNRVRAAMTSLLRTS